MKLMWDTPCESLGASGALQTLILAATTSRYYTVCANLINKDMALGLNACDCSTLAKGLSDVVRDVVRFVLGNIMENYGGSNGLCTI